MANNYDKILTLLIMKRNKKNTVQLFASQTGKNFLKPGKNQYDKHSGK